MKALNDINKNNSPRLDGFNYKFFTHYWHIIEK